MKKLILIALVFATMQAVAQDKRKRNSDHGISKREMVKDLTADEIATLGSKKMTLALDLSNEQQVQVKAVLLKQATKRKRLMEGHEKKVATDDTEKPSKKDRVAVMNARLDDKIAMKQDMKSILSAEQYLKWENIQVEKAKRIKDKRKGKAKH